MAKKSGPGFRSCAVSEKHILLVSMGTAPAVVTEALYVLAIREKVNISELHVITTGKGYNEAKARLLGPDGQIARMWLEYGLDPGSLKFGEETIHLLVKSNGIPVDDLTDKEENRICADQNVEVIRKLTGETGVVLHSCIAGGRKIMSLLFGAAMMLMGRPGDELFHILVSHDLENNRDFYYPPKKATILKFEVNKQQKTVNSKDVKITVAPIPYIRLRSFLPDMFKTSDCSYDAMVAQTQHTLDQKMSGLDAILYFEKGNNRLVIGDKTVKLRPGEAILYARFADARSAVESPERTGAGCVQWDKHADIWSPDAFERDVALTGYKARNEKKVPLDVERWKIDRSNLNKAIKAILDPEVAGQFTINEVTGNSAFYCIKARVKVMRERGILMVGKR